MNGGQATAGPSLIIWDFDGTLAYRVGGMWSAAILEVATAEAPGIQATPEQVRAYLHSGFPWHTPGRAHTEIQSAQAWWDALDPLFVHVFQGLGFGRDQARRMAKQVRRVYPDPNRWRLFDDTLPCLTALHRRGWLQAILSNHVPELPDLVEHLGIDRFVSRTFGSAQTGYEKPHPRAFQLVLEAYPDARHVVVVGDSLEADIVGARSVGLPGVLVRSESESAPYATRSLWQVPALLDAMWAGHAA